MKDNIKRRDFIKQTAASSIGLGLMTAGAPFIHTNGSANEKVVVAIMGTNSRGSALAQGFAKLDGAEVAYICDVDDQALEKGMRATQSGGQKKKPKAEKDIRKVLEDKSVDAIVIAAPDHWHAPAAIMALKAGKHVYVEKPCSHNPHEGEMLVEAASQSDLIVQMGNQRRSWPNIVEGIQVLKDGIIGRAYFARAWYANSRESIGYGKKAAVPAGLDYELWQGPAPRKPYQDNLIHYNWHWFWHWGTGELLNNGTHFIDLCRWGLGVDYPIRVSSGGGRYAYQDDWETPDTQITYYDFDDQKSISWEGRSCNRQNLEGISAGASFHGEKGTMVIDGNGYMVYDNSNKEIRRVSEKSTNALDATGPGFDLDQDHLNNFRACVISGKQPASHIEDANKSVHICHLGNIAHRTKRVLNCDPKNGKILGDEEAMALWGRDYEAGWEPNV
ncbi:Gfo/Idh/MocA family protein [Catalinimonas niigatensis]|uniref:Gfo/Idh/MocA family protein n=1 Tax=Catalinimonas niigatensis TaxID=1397264 RepID=UPI002666B7F4|nr:Gfo/Idh/MocA family oxidoreductase [Catalinimonas niigatensis]WPP50972.1 Gfo/Idh/MocA family oxidoreductase [Catalinimonas niigatensis]